MFVTVRFALALTCLAALVGLDRAPVESETISLTIDGATREALVVPPTNAVGEKAPLVLAFHGHGGKMEGFRNALPIHKFWPRAVVVYLQGLDTESKRDPQGKKSGWQRAAGDENDRDLKFVDAVVAKMRREHNIDDSQIYATGFSNGGFFSYLLWEERPKVFAAFATMSGNVVSGKLTEPKPVLVIAGEHDPLVTPQTSKELIQTVRTVNGATGKGQDCGKGCTLYSSDKAAPVMVLWHPGGHEVPPEAADTVVKFFKDLKPQQ